MSIEFKEEQIESYEKATKNVYAGYFSPDGALIHVCPHNGEDRGDGLPNQVADTFIKYAGLLVPPDRRLYRGYDSVVAKRRVSYSDIHRQVKNEYLELTDKVHDGTATEMDHFQRELIKFFENGYSRDKFFETINRTLAIDDPVVIEKRIRAKYPDLSEQELLEKIERSIKRQILSYLKDICVQYLGFDSLERYLPDGRQYNLSSDSYDFESSPRIITSSSRHINEKYYNYLIMGWDIHKVPRFIFNSEKGQYEKRSGILDSFSNGEEQVLHDEIESIKRLVPIHERHKFFKE